MTRLIHLTDLHFGQHHAEMLDPLARAIRASAAAGGVDLLVVSGDLSHRARGAQFRRAMAFVSSLGLPWLCVPGNHDVPLFNLPLRFVRPFHGYGRHVARDLAPGVRIAGATLVSANTADPFSWRRGILRRGQRRDILAALRAAPETDMRILVCHHPLTEPPGFQRGETRHAGVALAEFAQAGLDVVLSGHLHHWSIGLGVTAETPRRILQVQTGTALCARAGEVGHGFAVLDFSARSAITVTPVLWRAETTSFAPAPGHVFRRGAEGWLACPQAQAIAPPLSPRHAESG